jgi:hypothetical protein
MVRAYAGSLAQVFLCAAFVALAGFVFALFLHEAPLTGIHDSPTCLGDGFAVPRVKSPEDVLQIAVGNLLSEAPNVHLEDIAQRPECELDVAGLWGVLQIFQHERSTGTARLTGMARHFHLPHQVLEPLFDRLVALDYVVRDGDQLSLTADGLRQVDCASAVIRHWVVDNLTLPPDFAERTGEEFDAALRRISDSVIGSSTNYPSPVAASPPRDSLPVSSQRAHCAPSLSRATRSKRATCSAVSSLR